MPRTINIRPDELERVRFKRGRFTPLAGGATGSWDESQPQATPANNLPWWSFGSWGIYDAMTDPDGSVMATVDNTVTGIGESVGTAAEAVGDALTGLAKLAMFAGLVYIVYVMDKQSERREYE